MMYTVSGNRSLRNRRTAFRLFNFLSFGDLNSTEEWSTAVGRRLNRPMRSISVGIKLFDCLKHYFPADGNEIEIRGIHIIMVPLSGL